MSEADARYRLPKFIAGMDIGQMADPTALAILEWTMVLLHGQLEPRWDVRHLERVPLQTAYPTMARGLRVRLEQLRARCLVVLDCTGVGQAVVDDFREVWTEYDSLTRQRTPAPNKPPMIALHITGGETARFERWDDAYVPKRDIVMGLVLALQQHRFRVAASLPEAATLFKEGQNFQWKVSKAGNDLYGAWREGQHDDLLLAVAIAVWYGDRYAPRTLPNQETQYAKANTNSLSRTAAWRR